MAYVASMEIVTTKSKLACGGKWAYIPQCTQSQINALSFAKSGTNSLIILASVLGAFNIGSFNYIFVGKTSLHAAGSCRALVAPQIFGHLPQVRFGPILPWGLCEGLGS